MGVFKAYDIRGVYNKDWNKNTAYLVGFHLPGLLNAKEVLIGRDVRLSTPEIFEELCRGINDAGAHVADLGLSTTPMVYFFTTKRGYGASVMITASHNPQEYNGLKISRTGSLPVGYDTGLEDLERLVTAAGKDPSLVKKSSHRGQIQLVSGREDYLVFLKTYLPDITGLTLAIDGSNGMANLWIRELFGDSPHYINETLDGTFPGHEPNPLEEKNVEPLKHLVAQTRADLGIIYDGDADRVMFVDEKGQFISPDLITGILAEYFLRKEKAPVLHDIRTSRGVSEYISSLGAKPHMWKVGHAYAKVKMRELGAIVGGELAGHYYFRDFFNCDSGILASLIVLQELVRAKKEGLTFSALMGRIPSYANSGELNFKIQNKEGAMEALLNATSRKEPTTAFYDFDGYRVEYRDWWFNVRPSNTEPYLRLVVEAATRGILEEKLVKLKEILSHFPG